MAKVKGIVTLVGTIDGVNFYLRKGVPTARSAGGGFTAKNIKTKASMASVRRNNSEFGEVVKVNKLIKTSLYSVLLKHKEGTLHARMMSVLLQIKKLDLTSTWGERTVWNGLKLTEGKQLFLDFEFMPTPVMRLLCDGFPTVSFMGAFCSFEGITISRPAFATTATHIKIDYFVVDYNPTPPTYKRYEAASCLLALEHLPPTLPNFEVLDLPPTFDFRMCYVSVQFCQEMHGIMEILKGDGMGELKCLDVLSCEL